MLPLLPLAHALPPVDSPVATHVINTTDAAVVVGISDYLRVEDVPYAEADATTFAAFASSTLGIPASRIWRPANRNRENIERAVTEAGLAVHSGGTVWVYFAGHGAADPVSKERLLLGDDVPDDGTFASRGVSVTGLEERAGAGGARVVIITDVCYTGQFRSLVLDPPAPTGRVIEWSATQKGQVAAPLAGSRHGAFTYLLLGAFRGWADGEPEVDGAPRTPADGVVTAREARDYVQRQLAALQLRSQVPAMRVTEGLTDAALVRGVREAAPGLALPTATVVAPPSDYAAKLAALAKAQSDLEEARRVHDAGVATAVAARRAEATEAWTQTLPIAAKGDAAGRAAARLFLDSYAKATVTVDGEVVPVEVPEAAEAEAILARPVVMAKALPVAAKPAAAPAAAPPKASPKVPQPAPDATLATDAAPLVDAGLYGLGDETVIIPMGIFTLGTPAQEPDRDSDEALRRPVVDTFALARTEVSQGLWDAVMRDDPSVESYGGSSLLGERLPVQNVSWCAAVGFANRLSRLNRLTEAYDGVATCVDTRGLSVSVAAGADGWRLPTEDEWEYAARAMAAGAWGTVVEVGDLCTIGNVHDASAARFGWGWSRVGCDDGHDVPASVGSYTANSWGLFDMVGNVSEWVWSKGTEGRRGYRGGSWASEPADTRVGARADDDATSQSFDRGLRLARSLPH